jgi:hypothetical protein
MTVARHSILQPLKSTDGYKIQVRVYHILWGIPTQNIHHLTDWSIVDTL